VRSSRARWLATGQETKKQARAAKNITVGQRFDRLDLTSAVADLGNLDPGTTPKASARVLAVG